MTKFNESLRRTVHQNLLQLLLGPDVGGVTALLLAAVGGSGVEPGVALAADHLEGNRRGRLKTEVCILHGQTCYLAK